MKQFNLDEYHQDFSKKVITRDGRNVRIICTDRQSEGFPVVALCQSAKIWRRVDGKLTSYEQMKSYTADGKPNSSERDSNDDLFFAPEKKEGWISIYKTESGSIIPGDYIDDSEEASKNRTVPYAFSVRIATVKIEWEE